MILDIVSPELALRVWVVTTIFFFLFLGCFLRPVLFFLVGGFGLTWVLASYNLYRIYKSGGFDKVG